jgi:hypothetical protein
MDEGDPCRYWVSSESDGGVEYIVDLCEEEIGVGEDGVREFNGVCGLGGIHGCQDFYYRCRVQLKDPANKGKIFRCKHIIAAEKYALRLLKPYMRANRVNLPEDQTP